MALLFRCFFKKALTRFILCLCGIAVIMAALPLKQTIYAQTQPDTSHLKVGVTGHAPFIIADKGSQSGIAYELWNTIADADNWQYTPYWYSSVSEALSALQKGDLDLVIGPISITSERVKQIDFSQPYYFSGLSIMSRKDDPTILDRIRPLFSKKLLVAVLIFLFILGIVGTLLWLAERKHSPEQFPLDAPHGIANGMWLAIVTMSTTGYGDRAPITFWGRVLAGAWMVISIIFATTMVAGIASTLTLTGMGSNTITEGEQLKGKNVATPAYQTAAEFLTDMKAKAVRTSTLDKAYGLLKGQKVAAIVFDRPQLLYFQQTHPDDNIIVSRSVYDPNGYGFAFPLNSPLTKKVNFRMLRLNEAGQVNRIINSWIDEKNNP